MKGAPNPGLTRSVVICCYTEARWSHLVAAVDSASSQLGAGDELIVVVDHNDALLERAVRSFGDQARIVASRHERGLSGARNTGVELAKGPVVAFLDDDAAAAPGWLDALMAPFADASVAGVGGAAIPEWEGGAPPPWMPDEFYWVVGCSYRGLPTTPARVRNPIGCNMAFRTDAIRRVGGFSAALGRIADRPVGGEETDLAIRVTAQTGGHVVHVPSAVVHHAVGRERMTVQYFYRRCFSEGTSKAILARRVGVGDATGSERTYLRTLARGAMRRIGQSVRRRRLAPLVQTLMLAGGLAATTAGFAWGSLRARIGGPS